jgi:hypothetical protein
LLKVKQSMQQGLQHLLRVFDEAVVDMFASQQQFVLNM